MAALAALAVLLAAARDDPLAGYAPAGPAVRCLPDTNLSPVILDRQTVGLRYSGRRWYVSRVRDCPALEPLSTLIVEHYGGPLCDTDRFRVLEPQAIIPSAYCRFAPFVPYDKIKRR